MVDASSLAATVNWTFHTEQYRVFSSTSRTRILVAGRRWGKSEVLTRIALARSFHNAMIGKDGVSWVVLPTYAMGRPLWRKFLRLAPKGWITDVTGTERAPDTIVVGGKVRLEFKSAEHPERLVGEGLLDLFIDECGLVKERVYRESLMPALMDHKAPAFLGGTPKGKSWFYQLYTRGLDPLDTEVETFGGPTTQNWPATVRPRQASTP